MLCKEKYVQNPQTVLGFEGAQLVLAHGNLLLLCIQKEMMALVIYLSIISDSSALTGLVQPGTHKIRGNDIFV